MHLADNPKGFARRLNTTIFEDFAFEKRKFPA